MAGGIDWFRWHHGSVTDPKFQLVARKSGASLPDVLAVWAYVLEKASAAEFRGCFGELDPEAIDCLFGFDDGTTDAILSEMVQRKLIADEYVVAWEKRQPKRERTDDNSTDRVRAFREKQRHETPRNATERTETPREEKRRGEKRQTPPPPLAGGRFAEFWEAWPRNARKVARDQCAKKWQGKGLDAIADQVIGSVRAHRASPDWQKDDGAFIPAPLVWLNQARWEAVIEPAQETKAAARVDETAAYLAEQKRHAEAANSPEAREARARVLASIGGAIRPLAGAPSG